MAKRKRRSVPAAGTSSDATLQRDVPAIELERQRNIERNKKRLIDDGILEDVAALQQQVGACLTCRSRDCFLVQLPLLVQCLQR